MRSNVYTKRPDLKPFSTKQLRRFIKHENRKYTNYLKKIPMCDWPINGLPETIIEVWRSKSFLVQVHQEDNGIERLSIQTTKLKDNGEFEDGVAWEDIQKIKSQCGRGDKEAVEIFTADKDIVNVANMRHIWILTKPLSFTWRANK